MGGRDRRDELEWKVRMKAGETLVYSWQVQAPADQFYFDFHGESVPKPKVTVVSYRKGMGNAGNGSMVAPFDGIHGWYLQNQTDTIEVIYNNQFGAMPRLAPGQIVEACGDYITSNRPNGHYPASPDGAILHWVHFNPADQGHEDGYVVVDGRLTGQTPPKK